jgi:hypothetical protein
MSQRTRIEQRAVQRANGRCEYCRMHQSLQGATFHLEHIAPRTRGGRSVSDNLAWACPGCNLRKSNHVTAVDPATNKVVPLFHPRQDKWPEHFRWQATHVDPLTDRGRATAALLDLNHPRRIRIRQAEALFGLFPPHD